MTQNNIAEEIQSQREIIPIRHHNLSYISHEPFNITSDSDFETQAWPGNGSISNPYLIENLNITTNSSTAIWVRNTTRHFIIRNSLFVSPGNSFTLYQLVFPVTLTNVSNGEIRGNHVINSNGGISGYALSNFTISDNRFNVTWTGIDVWFSNFTTIFNNTQEFDPLYYGLSIIGSRNITVSLNQFRNILSGGIAALANYNSSFTENTLIASDSELVFSGNGIDLRGGETCIVSGNEIANFLMAGIDVSGKDHLVENNNITSSQIGILISTNSSTVRRNNLTDNFNSIELVKANDTKVYENTIWGESAFADTGIGIHGGYNSQIYSNVISHIGIGIGLQGATGFNISNNIVNDGRYGFIFGWYGFLAVGDGPSFDGDILNNSFDSGGLFPLIENIGSWDFDTIRFEGNTVNNRPIGFYAYLDGTVLDGDDYGQLFLVSSTDVTLTGGDFYGIISDRTAGIYNDPGMAAAIILLNSTGCELNDVRFHNNTIGVNIEDSTDCLLQNTTGYDNRRAAITIRHSDEIVISASYFRNNLKAITSSWSWNIRIFNSYIWENEEGIVFDNSFNSTISHNDIFQNTDAVFLGDSDGSDIFDNSIYENSRGLLLNSSSACVITENMIYNNTGVGISLDGTSNRNDIYENTFENNAPNAISEGSSNNWDDQVDTGNRWSDYSGEGPYIIDENDQDNYPIVDLPTTTPTTVEPWEVDPLVLLVAGGAVGVVALVIIIRDRRRVIIID
jgi:parallel beta-helix repeat protein